MVYTLRHSTGSITGLDTSFRGDTRRFLYRKTAIFLRSAGMWFSILFGGAYSWDTILNSYYSLSLGRVFVAAVFCLIHSLFSPKNSHSPKVALCIRAFVFLSILVPPLPPQGLLPNRLPFQEEEQL